MSHSERNFETLWTMKQENERRREELAAERRARETTAGEFDDPCAERDDEDHVEA
jgi:hypothetical protein